VLAGQVAGGLIRTAASLVLVVGVAPFAARPRLPGGETRCPAGDRLLAINERLGHRWVAARISCVTTLKS
jgi:hypothetical protein